MAKVVYGGGVAAMSGKSAGNVFSRNAGGSYVRNFKVPTNPNTARQQAARDKLGTWASTWRTLSDATRDQWNAWAQTHPVIDRLGASIILSGIMAFVKLNINTELAGLSPLVNPPTDPIFKTPVLQEGSLQAAASAGTMTVNAGTDLSTNDILFIWASPPVSPGITNTKNIERLISVITLTSDVDAGDPLPSIAGDFTATFGSITGQAGRAVNVTGFFFSQGQLSVGALARGIIQA